ncbi:sulfhydryl oxidase 1 [Drosophila grimshawi]|uniref:Sulfhydryl oxidase n=1 Tax=Drosophila grimshawi TaxID=7222 RepID=B4J5B5_DROGR|nr:sulfhydryl oxidase 1 [Drosophila grimshawi]EDW01757.1 GH20280 [Drosophila grimshawi]
MNRQGAQLALCLVVIYLLESISAGVPLNRYETLLKQQSEPQDELLGLYDGKDKVVKLNVNNFNETVLEQNRGSLVEFYNTYCGHCRRFAPVYKKLAEQLHPWQDVVIVSAIDCAAEENNGICRTYEVMSYPTLRYLGPSFQPTATQYGVKLETQNPDELRSLLAGLVSVENQTANNIHWPNVAPVTESDSAGNLFEDLQSVQEQIALIFEPENSTLAIETAMFLLNWPAVEVRRINDATIAAKFKIDSKQHQLALLDRRGAIQIHTPANQTSIAYAQAIESALRALNMTPRPQKQLQQQQQLPSAPIGRNREVSEIISEVHRNKHLIYQADLEQAIRTILHNEVSKQNEIGGEPLVALQRFLTVLERYNPLGTNGRQMVSKLREFVVQFNQKLSGQQFEQELRRLVSKLGQIYSTTNYVGCTGSSPHLRGFTCSLWTLFHYLSVQSAGNEEAQDPLEVLQAMHGYVRNFFGCTDCSNHFQEMAARRKIWSVASKDEAVLWLWAAHNEVNQRLAGDATEDPQFPKIQFPSANSCAQCRRATANASKDSLELNWNKDAVLSFLKNIHNPQFISRYGVPREQLQHEALVKERQKRQISSVFSDMDVRMGMFLYAFCIFMMVLAFKLFAFKGGYRKKPYGHDLLGKV